ncbi:hypothetical protein K502DRAFT_324832 [Neoconidiobolus thromboides FSU 785]|nr:hypothetical protein K502DRAFT_324832 [Neoconidiobolus thromboides FSU 785]
MDKDSWNPAPIWWCPLDETITMACLTSSVELVAILSLMRYIKICKQKEINPYFYYGLACFSVIASISLALGNVHYGIYKWSFTDMFCLPVLNNENEGPQNQIYYYAFFAIYVARLMLSLVIITFCYIKVTTAYRRALKTSIAISMDHQNRVESNVYLETKSCESVQIPSPEPDSISAMEKFKLKRALTTFKLLGATFAYVLCFMPDIILTILDLTIAPDYDVGPAILVNALVCSSGIVSGFFVLFSHQHCRSYFFHFINSIFRSIGLAS